MVTSAICCKLKSLSFYFDGRTWHLSWVTQASHQKEVSTVNSCRHNLMRKLGYVSCHKIIIIIITTGPIFHHFALDCIPPCMRTMEHDGNKTRYKVQIEPNWHVRFFVFLLWVMGSRWHLKTFVVSVYTHAYCPCSSHHKGMHWVCAFTEDLKTKCVTGGCCINFALTLKCSLTLVLFL